MQVIPKILVIEDDPSFRKLLVYEFSFDYNVIAVSDCEKATQMILEENPDLIICDLNLNGEDKGYEIVHFTKSTCPNTPIFLLTNFDDYDYRISGLECGADDYLGKSVSMEELKLRIRNALAVRAVIPLNEGDLTTQSKSNNLMEDEVRNTIRQIIKEEHQINTCLKINFQNVAKKMCKSTRTIQRGLKNEGTPTFREIKTSELLKHSLELFRQENNINRVAYSLGYESHSHFTLSFKEKFGVTPKIYIANNRSFSVAKSN